MLAVCIRQADVGNVDQRFALRQPLNRSIAAGAHEISNFAKVLYAIAC